MKLRIKWLFPQSGRSCMFYDYGGKWFLSPAFSLFLGLYFYLQWNAKVSLPVKKECVTQPYLRLRFELNSIFIYTLIKRDFMQSKLGQYTIEFFWKSHSLTFPLLTCNNLCLGIFIWNKRYLFWVSQYFYELTESLLD